MHRADHPSRGPLMNVVCLSVIVKSTRGCCSRGGDYEFAINAIVNFDHASTLNTQTVSESIPVVRIKVTCRITQLDPTSNAILNFCAHRTQLIGC